MSSSGISAATATAAVQPTERNLTSQRPARFSMPWNRPRNAGVGNGDSLPEWKLNCLCTEQGLLSPTVKGGVHIGGGWF